MHLFPPQNFGAVEDGIYRSGLPSELNYRFLESLHLKTVIVLSPESMDTQFASFLEDFRIRVVYIQNVSNDGFRGLSPVAEETVIEALHLLTSKMNLVSQSILTAVCDVHFNLICLDDFSLDSTLTYYWQPALLTCRTGKHLTGSDIAYVYL